MTLTVHAAAALLMVRVFAQASGAQTPGDAPGQPGDLSRVTCGSRSGERQECPADTSSGVTLVKSDGSAPCLLGKTWGYDDRGIWVADGCSAEFVAGKAAGAETKSDTPEYIPNLGFLLYDGENGQIYFRLFS